MPELPEVETVRRTLEPKVVGRKILCVRVLDPMVVRHPLPDEFARELGGRTIRRLRRRGKYLIADLDDGRHFIIHLKMTGRFFVAEPDRPVDKHTHVLFNLDDDNQLRFADVRKFGVLLLVRERSEMPSGLRTMGPEPLSRSFTLKRFREALARRKGRIKPLLLSQDFLAGLGNIYADEALFAARVYPGRAAGDLTEQETSRLFRAIKRILRFAIAHRGATLRDYLDADGREGEYGEALKVYGREGEPCPRCGSPIRRLVVQGRSSQFCPKCQR